MLASRDAIGSHVLHTRDVLRAAGYQSDIYAGGTHIEVADEARPLEELPAVPRPNSWLLFHHSTGAAVADLVARRTEPVVIDYHNVTPADLVAPWAPWLRGELELGAEQLTALAPGAFFGIAHSRFSEGELNRAGCSRTAVAPLLVDLGTLAGEADRETLAGLSSARRAAGGSDWLFVGRVSPHKAQHDLIKAFACYRRWFDSAARLHLVGGPLGADYPRALERFSRRLGVGDAVYMAGSVTPEALAAYYRAADVFVCASDHEGFCVPLVEAMHLGVPVVAYDSSAVGETVGSGGLVIEDKAPMVLASAAHRVVADTAVRTRLVEAGRRRARTFSLEAAGRAMAVAMEQAVHVGNELGLARGRR